MTWKLIDEVTGAELKVGDVRKTFRGEEVRITGFAPPHKPESTGKFYFDYVGNDAPMNGGAFYPGVIKAKYVQVDELQASDLVTGSPKLGEPELTDDELKPDFIASFGQFSTVWSIRAVSEAAKEFARDNIPVEDWMGTPESFTTDWRPAREICRRLAEEEGFIVACKQPDRHGMGVWKGR